MVTPIADLAFIFIGYDEPEREAHWQELAALVPHAHRIEGVKGLISAFQAAASVAETERFITIDADCTVDPLFLHHHVDDDKLNSNKVISWPAINVVNGLAYGNGGIKCWTRRMLHACKRPDAEHLDHTESFGFVFEARPFGTSHPNGSALQAFRSGFREGAKLGLVRGKPLGLDRLATGLPPTNLRRLLAWSSIGADVDLGRFCIWGARLGCLMAQDGAFERSLIADFDLFKLFFEAEIAPKAGSIDDEIEASGARLAAADIYVPMLGPMESAFVRDHVGHDIDYAAFDMLGNLYRNATDLPPHPEKAFAAFMSGALLGNSNAMNNVARCYREGWGVEADPIAAMNWLLNAAALDNPWALLRLGRGAVADGEHDTARTWLERAVQAGSHEASEVLAELEVVAPPALGLAGDRPAGTPTACCSASAKRALRDSRPGGAATDGPGSGHEATALSVVSAALAAPTAEDLLVVTFDQTLLLRDSTELFLDSARPAVLGAILVRLVEAVSEWLFGARRNGSTMPDRARVVFMILLMPWVAWRWRSVAPALTERYRNGDLMKLLHERRFEQIAVTSRGFGFIVAPMLRALPLGAELFARSLWRGWSAPDHGSLPALEARYGRDAVAGATVITNSAEHDQELLTAVAQPVVAAWSEARCEPAYARQYTPLVYTERAKHPTHHHVFHVYFAKDWMVLVLASGVLAPNPILAALGLALLILSYAIVYEVGYHENDVVGGQREQRPILGPERIALFGTVHEGQAWLLGTLVALPGVILLASSNAAGWYPFGDLVTRSALLLGFWLGLLGVIRTTFWIFNRIDELSRLPLHLLLQLLKGIGLVWVLGLPLALAGAALLVAHAVAKWIPYVVYRMGGARWQTPDNLIRLFLFLAIISGSLQIEQSLLFDWQTYLIVGWAIYKARKECLRLCRTAHILPVKRTDRPRQDSARTRSD